MGLDVLDDPADLSGMDATDITTCPLPIGHRRPAPSNRQALSDARRLMAKYDGTTFGATKIGGHWAVVRYA